MENSGTSFILTNVITVLHSLSTMCVFLNAYYPILPYTCDVTLIRINVFGLVFTNLSSLNLQGKLRTCFSRISMKFNVAVALYAK